MRWPTRKTFQRRGKVTWAEVNTRKSISGHRAVNGAYGLERASGTEVHRTYSKQITPKTVLKKNRVCSKRVRGGIGQKHDCAQYRARTTEQSPKEDFILSDGEEEGSSSDKI